MKKLKFQNNKKFIDLQGNVVSMKALLTIHKEQFVEVYENNNRYKANELTEI